MKRFCMLVALVLLGCQERARPSGVVGRAEFGIFFGGQVQEREQIPFEPSRARQAQGFRLQFRAPLERELRIEWEINRPLVSQGQRSSASGERVVQMGEAR
ncbi:MAG TPA: hypothetical protein VK524_20300, partial [Polyangiaceae bacterium]|nr:hypothetical protein [Polyangiaceae bacterium]